MENLDAGAAARQDDGNPMVDQGGGYPPGYVTSYDEGRPRK